MRASPNPICSAVNNCSWGVDQILRGPQGLGQHQQVSREKSTQVAPTCADQRETIIQQPQQYISGSGHRPYFITGKFILYIFPLVEIWWEERLYIKFMEIWRPELNKFCWTFTELMMKIGHTENWLILNGLSLSLMTIKLINIHLPFIICSSTWMALSWTQ